eukprot:354217-Chlamydomonas_euryale.AAC.2
MQGPRVRSGHNHAGERSQPLTAITTSRERSQPHTALTPSSERPQPLTAITTSSERSQPHTALTPSSERPQPLTAIAPSSERARYPSPDCAAHLPRAFRPARSFLGLSVGLIQADQEPAMRRAAYRNDITYVTNSELGFDFLRDNLSAVSKGRRGGARQRCVRRLCVRVWPCV